MSATIAFIGFGALALAAYMLHARRTAFPMLDLKLLSLQTFRAERRGRLPVPHWHWLDSVPAAADAADGLSA